MPWLRALHPWLFSGAGSRRGAAKESGGCSGGLSPLKLLHPPPTDLPDCSGVGVGFPFPVQELVQLLCQAPGAPHSPKGLYFFELL